MTSRSTAFLDADVLAAPMTRTLIIVSQAHHDALFVPRWSLAVEVEADRHIRAGQKPVTSIRESLDWDSMLVPDADSQDAVSLTHTSPKDRHVLATAIAAGARILVTRNVSDFGAADLVAAGVSAAHPDLFLATTMSEAMYHDALTAMSAARSREPNTPESLHAAFGVGHPRLFQRMRHLFPSVEPLPTTHRPPVEIFRGSQCLICGHFLADDSSRSDGICSTCANSSQNP